MRNKIRLFLIAPWLILILMIVGNTLSWGIYTGNSMEKTASLLMFVMSTINMLFVLFMKGEYGRYAWIAILELLMSVLVVYLVINLENGISF